MATCVTKYLNSIDSAIESYQNKKVNRDELKGALAATIFIGTLDVELNDIDKKYLQQTATLCCRNNLTVAELCKAIENNKPLK